MSVENLSREMGVSRMQLHRKLTALTGHSPSELIREHRLQRAADLLRQKAGNVSEIAFQTGFDNLPFLPAPSNSVLALILLIIKPMRKL